MIIIIKAFVHYNCYEEPKLYLQFLLQKGSSGSQQLPPLIQIRRGNNRILWNQIFWLPQSFFSVLGKVTTYREGAHDSGQSE